VEFLPVRALRVSTGWGGWVQAVGRRWASEVAPGRAGWGVVCSAGAAWVAETGGAAMCMPRAGPCRGGRRAGWRHGVANARAPGASPVSAGLFVCVPMSGGVGACGAGGAGPGWCRWPCGGPAAGREHCCPKVGGALGPGRGGRPVRK